MRSWALASVALVGAAEACPCPAPNNCRVDSWAVPCFEAKDEASCSSFGGSWCSPSPAPSPAPSPSPSPPPGPGSCSSRPGDCAALDVGSAPAASAEECCQACESHQGCSAAVFVEGGQWGQTCFFKGGCLPKDGCVGDRCTTVFPSPSQGNDWYKGIESILVVRPADSVDWESLYKSMRQAQFSDRRWAVLLTSGEHDAQIGVGYYTHVMGVGATRNDVTVKSFYSLDLNDDGSGGGATQNFWRAAEGLTATNPSLTWATSQACPVRRCLVEGDFALSLTGPGTHWSSGGYLADTEIRGQLACGTQQQFFFRNNRLGGGVDCEGLSNGAFVGTMGDGTDSEHISHVDVAARVAEKPFLVEQDGAWHIAVPNIRENRRDVSDDTDVAKIPMADVFVARAGQSATEINSGLAGKRALLLTPGIYDLDSSLVISQPDFVVLGIGFPTLVARSGHSALTVDSAASGVRVAHVLLEAGTAQGQQSAAMLEWLGANGIGSDIFTRVGAFSGRGCMKTQADVHVQISGDGTILDNTWLWHADHDDCDGASDQSWSKHGLLVDGDSVTVYGLKVEHTMQNLVQWNGEDGKTFFFQAELPYHTPDFGSSGFVGYYVKPTVARHSGLALGVYIVGGLEGVTAIRVPEGVDLENLLAWCITGSASQFQNVVCAGSHCYAGDCSDKMCRVSKLPSSSLLIA